MRSSYRVEGMTCGGCAGSVTRAIQAQRPESDIRVEVELGSGRVTVIGELPPEAVQEAVEDAGFEFRGPFGAS